MAARRSGSSAFSRSAAALMALAGTPTLSAATTWPLRDSSGTASEHNPTSIGYRVPLHTHPGYFLPQSR